jgi:hypothetical protein
LKNHNYKAKNKCYPADISWMLTQTTIAFRSNSSQISLTFSNIYYLLINNIIA